MKDFVSVILAAGGNNDFKAQRLSETKLQFSFSESSTLLHEVFSEYKSPTKNIIACLGKDVKFFQSLEYFQSATFIEIKGETAGAFATLGLTIDHIDEDVPILVTPGDGLMFDKIHLFLEEMMSHKVSAGVIVFPSTNANYSYVRSIGNIAVEITEKKIVGRLATAGVYYFESKKVLLESLKWVLLNNLHVGGLYYMSVGINYLIAQRNHVRLFEIAENDYFRFATPEEALSSRERMGK